MNIYVSEIGGEFYVSFTGFETKEELEEELEDVGKEERLIHFYWFDSSSCSNMECEEAFGVIDALICLDSTKEVLEELLTTVYRLGR